MKRVMLVLKDDGLYKAVETEAAKTGRTVQDIVIEALEQWLSESELDELEQAETDAARSEWQEQGGTEAREFFSRLKENEGIE